MNRLTRFGALSVFLSLVLWGGKDVAAAPISAALSSTQLKDLTDADVASACQVLAPSLSLSKEDTCEFAGILWSTVGQACDAVKEKCMTEADQPRAYRDDAAPAPPPSCLPPADARAGCTATLAEYEACLLSHVARLRALTCDSPASTLDAPVPECQLITQKCPDLADDDGGGQGAAQP